ncbi:hypothetical protein KS08_10665 [Bacillus subtilis]|uniref:hypothetical protein n=1 Tax=Bacillus amyloliquefaciens group TaxID=1938374 RepID=UPI0002059766|nr:hypothetical protein [Bacillus amyloliquefaciens]AEB23470.1 hypothetical protein BAMTA208_06475 [Bacillus amyloliquefaciens TA208]AIW34077.1 hypothetical protein KS08_10665 [Bacillus subtilis]AEK88471.1 hypothetical protein BAXH7_01333 [Bacillus amyloliquefaciens XH7]MEC0967137.1 hypothetical protein [Bacillus amyloliquefaciens]MEC1832786.1 hypothetical protein [Bacillus amyloliquefaciens]
MPIIRTKSFLNNTISLSDFSKTSLVKRIIEKEKMGYVCTHPIKEKYFEFVAAGSDKKGSKYKREYIGYTKFFIKMALNKNEI